jgi:hypothetical protein
MNLSNGDSSASVFPLVNIPQLNPQLSTVCSVDCLQDNSSARNPRKTSSSVVKNACLLACYLTMDICEPHRKHFVQHLFYFCLHVFRELPRTGSTCHNINGLTYPLTFEVTYISHDKLRAHKIHRICRL